MNTSLRRVAVCAAASSLVATAFAAPALEPTLAEEGAFRAAVSRVAAAVVRIETVVGTAGGGTAAASTGLVVDPTGLVVTTAFAVPDDATTVLVVLADGRRLAARQRGRDRIRGLVLLACDPPPDAVAVEPAPRADLAAGQWTIAVGRGWTASEPSMAVGILSAVDRAWGLAVQTDAAVSPANYGGPLVDIAGRVIGIVAPLPADAPGMPSGTDLYDSGIGFAVPLEDVLRVLPELAAGRDVLPGLLGIGYRSRDPINGEPVIGSVRQGSPAAHAGLRSGDRITALDGHRITRVADVRRWIAPRPAGEEIEIEVDRADPADARRLTVRAALCSSLPPWRQAVLGVVPGSTDESHPGLPVARTLPDGPAAVAGIVAGDLIESLAPGAAEPIRVDSLPAALGVIAGLEPGQELRAVIAGAAGRRELTITLGEVPGDVPAAPADAAAGEAAVVTLRSADEPSPPLAVIPSGTAELGTLVWFAEPRGAVTQAEADAWRSAAARHGVAVILPASAAPRQWSSGDVATVARALETLAARTRLDPRRLALAGARAGGGFAWLVADRLGGIARGVAIIDGSLPRRLLVRPAEPGSVRWVLLGRDDEAGQGTVASDRRRLVAAGHTVGTVDAGQPTAPPAELLCRWVAWLGLL